jgi:hypothetical protein
VSVELMSEEGACDGTDAPAAGAVLTGPDALRAAGACPWSGCGCRRAKLCVMTAPEACAHIVFKHVRNCRECRETNENCDDAFLCFRDVRDAATRRGRSVF